MGYEKIEAVFQDDVPTYFRDAFFHLLLREHIMSILITHGAAETEDPESVKIIDRVFDTVAAHRRLIAVALVMVSVHVKERRMGHGHEIFKVGHRQIAAGNDEVHTAKLRLSIIFVKRLILIICDTQDFHNASINGYAYASSTFNYCFP